jgi:hypothetical protein
MEMEVEEKFRQMPRISWSFELHNADAVGRVGHSFDHAVLVTFKHETIFGNNV